MSNAKLFFAPVCVFFCLFSFILQISAKENDTSQGLAMGIKWVSAHLASSTNGGLLEVGEEVIATDYVHSKSSDNTIAQICQQLTRQRVESFMGYATQLDSLMEDSSNKWCLPTYLAVLNRDDLHNSVLSASDKNTLLHRSEYFASHADRPTFIIWNAVYLVQLKIISSNSLTFDNALQNSITSTELRTHQLLLALKSPPPNVSHREIETTANDLAHELFGMTAFGQLYPPPPIIETNEFYFSVLFNNLIEWAVASDSLDFACYSVICVDVLHLKYVTNYKLARFYILSRQNDDGSFGVKNINLRHSTLLAIMALAPPDNDR